MGQRSNIYSTQKSLQKVPTREKQLGKAWPYAVGTKIAIVHSKY